MTATRVQSASNVDGGTTAIVIGSGQGWSTPTSGNVLVAWYSGDNTCSTPTGFTAGSSVVDNNAVYLFYKASNGTESSVTFTQGGSTDGACGLIEYSGVTASPFDTQVASGASTTNGTSIAAVSVTNTGADGDIHVAVAGLGETGAASAPASPVWTNSFTNIQTVTSGTPNTASFSMAFVAEFQNTAAATVSTGVSWTNQIACRQLLLISFKLAAGAAAQIPTLVMARSA